MLYITWPVSSDVMVSIACNSGESLMKILFSEHPRIFLVIFLLLMWEWRIYIDLKVIQIPSFSYVEIHSGEILVKIFLPYSKNENLKIFLDFWFKNEDFLFLNIPKSSNRYKSISKWPKYLVLVMLRYILVKYWWKYFCRTPKMKI